MHFHSRHVLLACACALAGLLAPLARAAALPAADSQAIDLDLQHAKEDALAFGRDLQLAEQKMLYPDQSRLSLYVGVKVGGFLLDEITIRVNDGEPVSHAYTDSEQRALLKGDGLHRLLRTRLEPGSYRLQGSWTGHFYDAKPGEAPIKGGVETVFDKGLTDLDLVLPISRNSRLDRPGLSEVSRLESRKLRPSRNIWLPGPQQYEPLKADRGVLDDPRYRFALFLKEDGRYLTALTELLELEQTAADPTALPADFKVLAGDCYLGFGMDEPARLSYEQVAGSKVDAEALARAQLQLARFEYQRGYYDRALQRLDGMHATMRNELAEDWHVLRADTLLALGRNADVIDGVKPQGDDVSPVLRYNLAVALLRTGKPTDARAQLDRIGSMDVTSVDALVLRDRANLSLGYLYLQGQQGNEARTAFARVRATGPFANRALLGLGWSEVAGATAKQKEPGTAAGDSAGPKAPVPGLGAAEQQALLRALVPWATLAKRDPMDPAVQEGMLAIPWALDRLQDYGQSLSRYQDAIAALELARKRMDDAARSIKGGRMVETIVRRDLDSEKGWTWRLRDLPDAPETYFLQALLAEHRFQEALKNYRDARLLARTADGWTARLDALEHAAAGANATERQLLQQARKGWHPAWAGTVVWLGLETSLGAPGAYDAPLPRAAPVPYELQTLLPPDTFEGRREQLKPLRARLQALKPKATALGTAQDDALEAVSLHELDGQKQTIERYLTEARFAVARIYDRQGHGK